MRQRQLVAASGAALALLAFGSAAPLAVSPRTPAPLVRALAPLQAQVASAQVIDPAVLLALLDDALAGAGFELDVAQHFIQRMIERGINVFQVVDIMLNGQNFWDNTEGGYIYFKDGVAIVQQGFRLVTVMLGRVQSGRWIPLSDW